MLVYLILLALLLLCLVCRNDKILVYVLVAVSFILFALNTHNGDMVAYKLLYSNINSLQQVINSSVEIGYSFICYICSQYLNLSYNTFLAIIAIPCLYYIMKIILRNTYHVSLVMALFFIAPFFPSDINQVRNFIAETIVLKAIIDLIRSQGQDLKKYVVYILVASGFHVTSLFYLIFILIFYVKDTKKLYLATAGMCVFAGVLPTLLSRLPFINLAKVTGYMGNGVRLDYKSVILVATIFVLFLFQKKFYKELKGKHDGYFVECSYKMHILLLFVSVLVLVYSFNFYRLTRNLLLIDYICLSKYLKHKNIGIVNVYVPIYVLIGIYWSAANMLQQWNVILKNNMILQYLW